MAYQVVQCAPIEGMLNQTLGQFEPILKSTYVNRDDYRNAIIINTFKQNGLDYFNTYIKSINSFIKCHRTDTD